MFPKINDVLYLQVVSMDEQEASQFYKSRISEIQDAYYSIEVPLNEKTGGLKRLYAGDALSAYFITEGGVKNYFNTEVIGLREDVIKLVVIKRPEPEAITRVQRRNFLRVPAELEVACNLQDQVHFVTKTEDVSGGGTSFQCEGKIPLKDKDTVSMWLLIPFKNGSIDHVQCKGEVVRVKKLETGRQLVMLSFTDVAEGERQKIMKYCFERQLDFRKK